MFTWVYKYRYWDADQQQDAVASESFTLDAIRRGLGVPIIESGIKVRHENVDDSGRFHAYVPRPEDAPRPETEI